MHKKMTHTWPLKCRFVNINKTVLQWCTSNAWHIHATDTVSTTCTDCVIHIYFDIQTDAGKVCNWEFISWKDVKLVYWEISQLMQSTFSYWAEHDPVIKALVQCDCVNFANEDTDKIHSIALPQGYDMLCLLCVRHMIYIVPCLLYLLNCSTAYIIMP